MVYEIAAMSAEKEKCKYDRSLMAQQLTIDGVTKTITQWSHFKGLRPATVYNRITKNGWSLKKAVTTKPMSRSASGRNGAKKSPWRFDPVGNTEPFPRNKG